MKIDHIIDINASPEAVWAVTEDVERWPEWTPTIESVRRVNQGPFDVGSTAWIKQPGMPESEWTVTALTKGERFTWEAWIRGMRIVATHEIVASEDGTQNKLTIEVTGLVARILWPLMRRSTRKLLEQENMGLKVRCELGDAP